MWAWILGKECTSVWSNCMGTGSLHDSSLSGCEGDYHNCCTLINFSTACQGQANFWILISPCPLKMTRKKREVDNLETGFSKVLGKSSWSVNNMSLQTQLYFTSTYLASPVLSHSLLGHFTWQDRIFLSVALSGNISCKETNNHLQSKLNNKLSCQKIEKKFQLSFFKV